MNYETVISPSKMPQAVKNAKPFLISKGDKGKYFDPLGQVIKSDFVRDTILANKQVVFECKGVVTSEYLRYIIEGEASKDALFLKLVVKSRYKYTISSGKYK